MTYKLPSRIAARRQFLGLSRKELADTIEVSETQIRRYENGENDPSGAVIIRLCRALHVTSDWLIGMDDVNEVSPNGRDHEDEASNVRLAGHIVRLINGEVQLDPMENLLFSMFKENSDAIRAKIVKIVRVISEP